MATDYKQPKKSAQPKNWTSIITKTVGKVFSVLRAIAHLTYTILENAFRLITFCFNLIVKLVSNPATPCVVAICLFMVVSTIAVWQWYAIGVWLGVLLKIPSTWGMGSGMMGVLLGLGINVYQLAPILWRIREDIAKAYVQLGIEVNNPPTSETPLEKLGQWISTDYGTLKKIRLVSYGVETTLVISYCFIAADLNFFAIMQAAIALLLPEQCLQLVSSTIAVLGTVQEQMHKNAEDDSPEDHVCL